MARSSGKMGSLIQKNAPTDQRKALKLQAAETVYKGLQEAERATFEVASGYGRWLIASLVVIHGGGIVGAFGLLKEAASNAAMLSALATAIVWLLSGLLLALACGFATWLNWSFISNDYYHMANPEMLWNAEVWAREPKHTFATTATYWLSLAFGVLSASCTVGAASSLLSHAATAAGVPQ